MTRTLGILLAAVALAGCGGGQSKLARMCAQGRRAAEADAGRRTAGLLAGLPPNAVAAQRQATHDALLKIDLDQFQLAHRVDCRY